MISLGGVNDTIKGSKSGVPESLRFYCKHLYSVLEENLAAMARPAAAAADVPSAVALQLVGVGAMAGRHPMGGGATPN